MKEKGEDLRHFAESPIREEAGRVLASQVEQKVGFLPVSGSHMEWHKRPEEDPTSPMAHIGYEDPPPD